MDAAAMIFGLGIGLILSGFYAMFGIGLVQRRRRQQTRRAIARSTVHYLNIERREDGSELWTCDRCDYASELNAHGLVVYHEGDRRAWHTARGSMFDPRMDPATEWAERHTKLIASLDDAYRQPG